MSSKGAIVFSVDEKQSESYNCFSQALKEVQVVIKTEAKIESLQSATSTAQNQVIYDDGIDWYWNSNVTHLADIESSIGQSDEAFSCENDEECKSVVEVVDESPSSSSQKKSVQCLKKRLRTTKPDEILMAMKTFKLKFGHCIVPQRFKIDKRDLTWPEETRGMKLGQCCMRIRSNKAHKSLQRQLVELGMDFEIREHQTHSFETIFEALKIFKHIHGHLNVSCKYQVPSVNNVTFPDTMLGMKLGCIVHNMRIHNTHIKQKNRLIELGLDFSTKQYAKPWPIDILCEAIKSFKNQYNHVKVPQKFVIPVGSEKYPEATWGMKLGIICSKIRHRGSYQEHRQRFTALGLVVG